MWKKAAAFLIQLSYISQHVSALQRAELFPYGPHNGDLTLQEGDDETSQVIALSKPMRFYDTTFNKLYVATNGIISPHDLPMEKQYVDDGFPTEFPVIAPFLADIDTSNGKGAIYYRQTESPNVLNRVAAEVQKGFPGTQFTPTHAIIATWENVAAYKEDTLTAESSRKVNTFQAVVAYDEENTYALFLYPEDGLQFFGTLPKEMFNVEIELPARIGFTRGEISFLVFARTEGPYFSLTSNEQSVKNLYQTSNTDVPGVWLFHIGNAYSFVNVIPAAFSGRLLTTVPQKHTLQTTPEYPPGEYETEDDSFDEEQEYNIDRDFPNMDATEFPQPDHDASRTSGQNQEAESNLSLGDLYELEVTLSPGPQIEQTDPTNVPAEEIVDSVHPVPKHTLLEAYPVHPEGEVVNVEDEVHFDTGVFHYSTENKETCDRFQQTCSQNAYCADYPSGYCCHCSAGFYGNGRHCLPDGAPQRVNGKVNGMVSVGSTPVGLDSIDLHVYSVVGDGRAYTAISEVPEPLGWALMPVTPIGSLFGWLFALKLPNSHNGFNVTGAEFTRHADVTFYPGNQRLTIVQTARGLDNQNYLSVETHLEGSVPFVPPGASIQMEPFSETYQYYPSWKGRELADVMERRKVDILCVQETRWKGSKARSIGAGFKLFYYGVDSKRNGVGVVLKEEFVRNVLEVKRVSDRVMSLKLEIEGVMLNVVSGYAPQVDCELVEKERFWSELDEVMESIPTGERVVIGADFNGHVGEGNTGDEEVMGKFGVKERNLEGQMVVDFAKRMDMGVVNTYFQKREEHRVTYKSGGRRTQVDYILCRRGNLKEISDCKVVVGESVARQHRMVVCRMTLMVCKTKRSKIEKKTKWWKLKKEECCEEFRQKLRQALGGQVVLPDDWETTAEVIRETGRKVLGVSSGRRKEDKETWWWNEEVQDSIQRKRLAKKKWDMDRTEENRQEYKELQHRVKREVSKAKQKAYEELYTRLDTREGEKDLYRLARQRDRDGKDVQQKVDKIRKDEVRKALKRMKSGKAVGPDDIPVEVWKCLGEAAVEFLASLFNRVLESERMPEEWRRSVLVPIFKNKGDVQSCSNYRGIKLMSHTMKVWERVVEARLRKVVEICEQQYGFMPRKSTTDAIFALRILMEKYRDGQKELHCVFVDLEKAYDRVPREELWYCMRKSGVAEKYVRVVKDMYERSRTVVRCAVGQTEEFNVEVGLHQGSALSPFLFAIVMDQLSEEVRQESPWTMMFADDIVICSESREQVEENLERWRFALERRGMKVSGSKTEYMCVNEREGSGTVRLQGEEVKKVQEFKYLGSTVQSNGECGKEVKKRVQAGWNGWRKVSGVLCDQKISVRIKGKVYRTVVRPAMLYGLETVSLRKRQESELEVAELKMLRFSLGVTRLDRIRNEYIRGTAHVGRLGDKVREARLRWFGHVQRRDSEYIVITSNSVREFTIVSALSGAEKFTYQLRQNITYRDCRHTPHPGAQTLQLNVERIFAMYVKEERVLRYAITNKIGRVGDYIPEPQQENPCYLGSHDCDTTAQCVPGEGQGFTCVCATGYTGDGRNCYDVDECTEGLSSCGSHAQCVNLPGSHSCQCRSGFEYGHDSRTCRGNTHLDINRFCGQLDKCINVIAYVRGVFYSLNADVDECQRHPCHPHASCTNIVGSFQCQCQPGFHGDGVQCHRQQSLFDEKHPKTQCEHHRDSVQSGVDGLSVHGAYVPQCDEQGHYRSQQCHGSTGYCWCVDIRGQERAGTRTRPGTPAHNCDAPEHPKTQCEHRRDSAQREVDGLPVQGAYIPQCDEEGHYRPRQCHASTGHCWCVDSRGRERAGTRTSPGSPPTNCDAPDRPKTQCEQQRDNVQGTPGGLPLAGAFVPQCDDEGNYWPRQCHSSTGHCWCVDSRGQERVGTRTPHGTPLINCDAPERPKTPCERHRQSAQHGADGVPVLGAFIPECDEEGRYRSLQCHGSTGHCWCVDSRGQERAGTRTPHGTPLINCDAPERPKTPCEQHRQSAQHGADGVPVLGAFIPECDEEGRYRSLQCHGSTGHCWCVDSRGQERAGTRTPHGTPLINCDAPERPKTPCEQHRHSAQHGADGVPVLGAFIPECDEEGRYRSLQCHGSTGHCWCMDSRGQERVGTRTPPGTQPTDCDAPVHPERPKTACEQHRDTLKAKMNSLGNVGAYIPQCDEEGRYKSVQCHGSSGHCWCVDSTGQERAGTRTPPGTPNLDCDAPERPKTQCEQHRDSIRGRGHSLPLTGVYIPQCDEEGRYKSVQCHGSTGHCWCVDSTGQERAGTRTGPDTPNVDCDAPVRPERPRTACEQHRDTLKAKMNSLGNVGAYIPQCDEEGRYKSVQCHGSTGYCWCVDSTGQERAGTRRGPGAPNVDCDAPERPKTQCEQHRDRAQSRADGSPGVGAFIPQCDEEGHYRSLQCHGSTGHCWCVDTRGQERPGTRTPPGSPRRNCDAPVVPSPRPETVCERWRASLLANYGGRPGPEHFLPQCDESGEFISVQCYGETNYCWCVDRHGQEVPGTRSHDRVKPACIPTVAPPTMRPLPRPDVTPLPSGTTLLYAQGQQIGALPLNGTRMDKERSSVLLALHGSIVVGIDYDCRERKVYWTDLAGRTISRASLEPGSEPEILINYGLMSPEGLAVDEGRRRMFWVDSTPDKIETAKLDGSDRRVLFSTDLVNPRAIVVDSLSGTLYWTDWNREAPKIESSTVEGQNRRILVRDGIGLPNALTIDPTTRRICWADAGTKSLECIAPDGTGRHVIHSELNYPFSMVFYANHFYYTDWRRDGVIGLSRDSSHFTDEYLPDQRSHLYGITVAPSSCL
ncbi:hypothetical protein QTP86_030392 [Hemibagrus guttatus]|nr:hypothetical protein QTP86_030392 [Hemibagrus guttatus]